MKKKIIEKLRKIAMKTIDDCNFRKEVFYLGRESVETVLLPSGDEKYISFWVRDCAMMAESGLIPDEQLKKYIEIIATHGQNGNEPVYLDNNLVVPPYAIADHINYDGRPVFFPGTYSSGNNQGDGGFGFYPPFCDNYYFILMTGAYIEQSGDVEILHDKCGGMSLGIRLELAFSGYGIDAESGLCVSDAHKHTVDWGFTDSIKKSGKLLMPSLLRYNAAKKLQMMFTGEREKHKFYGEQAEKIKKSIIAQFYDSGTGWLYSATGICRQYDVWATAFAVFSGVINQEKTLKALYDAYISGDAVANGYVRHILKSNDFSANSAWECTATQYDTYQNGAYWATPVGWYAYALCLYNGSTDILTDFVMHTEKHKKDGAPFEWINAETTEYSGLNYGTSGVLPYIGAIEIEKRLAKA